MTKIIDSSIKTLKEGIQSLKNIKKDKQEYKKYKQRIKALPNDYLFTYEKITNYMWSYYGGGNGYDMINLTNNLLELFEESVAEGKRVLEVTGEDIASFCDELLLNTSTYTEKRRDKLNREIKEKIQKKI
ncbi:MAG: DUF1048 domain-containing protein [Oscillospiraceae bacterium]